MWSLGDLKITRPGDKSGGSESESKVKNVRLALYTSVILHRVPPQRESRSIFLSAQLLAQTITNFPEGAKTSHAKFVYSAPPLVRKGNLESPRHAYGSTLSPTSWSLRASSDSEGRRVWT